MSFVRLLNTDSLNPEYGRRRVWIYPGSPLAVGDARLCLFLDREDGITRPVLSVFAPTDNYRRAMLPGDAFKLTRRGGLLCLPRAVEYGPEDRPARYLLEFAAFRAGAIEDLERHYV